MTIESIHSKLTDLKNFIDTVQTFEDDESLRTEFMDKGFEVLDLIRVVILGILDARHYEYDRDNTTGKIALKTAYLHIVARPCSFQVMKDFGTKYMVLCYFATSDKEGTHVGMPTWISLTDYDQLITENDLTSVLQGLQSEFNKCASVVSNSDAFVAQWIAQQARRPF
jgi:hypothetical protein